MIPLIGLPPDVGGWISCIEHLHGGVPWHQCDLEKKDLLKRQENTSYFRQLKCVSQSPQEGRRWLLHWGYCWHPDSVWSPSGGCKSRLSPDTKAEEAPQTWGERRQRTVTVHQYWHASVCKCVSHRPCCSRQRDNEPVIVGDGVSTRAAGRNRPWTDHRYLHLLPVLGHLHRNIVHGKHVFADSFHFLMTHDTVHEQSHIPAPHSGWANHIPWSRECRQYGTPVFHLQVPGKTQDLST